jgi:glycosyltransferase involved in cell wall biosynthesis
MHILLIDPALREKRSHHSDWDFKIADYLTNGLGHNVTVYASCEINEETLELFSTVAKVVPLFSMHPYKQPRIIGKIAGESEHFLRFRDSMYEELSSVAAGDLWLLPTLFDYQVAVIAQVRPQCPILGVIHFDWEASQRRLSQWIWHYGALAAKAAGIDMRYRVSVPELVPVFASVLDADVRTMPFIYDACPPETPRQSLKRIGFFGNQRDEKGAGLIDSLVPRLIEAGYEVLLHDSSGQFARKPPHPDVRIVSYSNSLASEIAGCDLLVAPYLSDPYRRRMSGVVVEALSVGVPVVVARGSSPGNLVARYDAGILFEEFSLDSVLAAVAQARDHYHSIARGAYGASLDIAEHHGLARFVGEALPVS